MKDRIMTELQYQALALMQALIGAISPNFRMIWISVKDTTQINIILEEECADDFEEIEDLKGEFEALQERSIDYEIKIFINNRNLEFPDIADSVIVYKRREI